jgi:hypothetical protein
MGSTGCEPGIISRRTGRHSGRLRGLGLPPIIWIASPTLHTRRMTHFFEECQSLLTVVYCGGSARRGGRWWVEREHGGMPCLRGELGEGVIVWWWLGVLPEGTRGGGVQARPGCPFTTRERRPRKNPGDQTRQTRADLPPYSCHLGPLYITFKRGVRF